MTILPIVAFLIAVVANLILAALVIRRNSSSATNQLFALLGIVLSLWATANFVSFITTDYSLALITIRIVMALAIVQSILFALLMHSIPHSSLGISGRSLSGVIILVIIGLALSASPYLVESIEVVQDSAPQPSFGWGLLFFVPVTLGSIIFGTILLIRKNIKSTGVARVQQKYILIGLLLTFFLVITLILYRAVIRQDTQYVPYAPLFTLPFIALTGYTIARHRLMDVRAALFRGLSLTFLVWGLLSIYGLLLVYAVPHISEIIGIKSDIVAAAAALVSIPLARYVQQILTKITDKFLFQGKADYQKELVNLSRQLSGTINIQDVTETILDAMKNLIRSSEVIIFLQEPETGEFVSRAVSGERKINFSLEENNVLPKYLRDHPRALVKDELAFQKEREHVLERVANIERVENSLQWLDASVVLPLFVNKELTGIIVIGPKLSGEPFLRDDINFLGAFAPQAATALENARLYQESLEFSQKLEAEVERATHELAVANEQLRDLDKAKSEFLSIASHQLYTPLTALRGYLSMIMEGDFGKVPGKQQPIYEILEKSSSRLIELIRELLDISRIEAGRLELNLEEIDLAEMSAVLVRDLLPNAMTKNLDLVFKKPETTMPKIIGDKQRLRQVMLNFVDNSIKYTEKGSIEVSIHRDRADLVFSVTDTGKGLSPAEIARLFTKFTRVGGSNRFHTEGSGLGLYVAKQLVEEHRGSVDVTSPGPGLGSTFSMRIPIAGSPRSHKVGEKAVIGIKAAEATSAVAPEEKVSTEK